MKSRSMVLMCSKVDTDHSGTNSEVRHKIVKLFDESTIQQLIGNGSERQPEWRVFGFVVWPELIPNTVTAKMSDRELLESFACGGNHDIAIEIARRFQLSLDAMEATKASEAAKVPFPMHDLDRSASVRGG